MSACQVMTNLVGQSDYILKLNMREDSSVERRLWLAERKRLETLLVRRRRSTPLGERAFATFTFFDRYMAAAFGLVGLSRIGRRNAASLQVERLTLTYPQLPAAFNGYTILHLSDLHIGNVPDQMERAAQALSGLTVDMVVLSGDYQTQGAPSAAEAASLLRRLLSGLAARDGIVAVLGNHDAHEMAGALEGLGVTILINEGIAVKRGGSLMWIVGTDDVNSFYSEAAPKALHRYGEGFRIAVVHSADLATVAADAGYALYLTGHTHGGQVCLSSGRPLLTAQDTHRELASGLWQWRGMFGHTSRGVGSGRPALRFNCQPEATVLSLVKKA